MPFPKGTDPEKAVGGYIAALHGFPIDAIALGIRRFIRGECKDVSAKFCPHPPELANIIRTTRYIAAPQPQEPRGYVSAKQELPGASERMRLKMPLFNAAFGNKERMDQLDRANREGFGAMVVLATNWGVPIPQELLDRPDAEDEWRRAHNRAWASIEANPPPFMRTKRWKERVVP